jgi:hypothetical protein
LVTSKPGFANVPVGTVFGKCEVDPFCGPTFAGATPDSSHVVLISSVALTSTAQGSGLYEWSAGKLVLVSVLPGPGEEPTSGILGRQGTLSGGTAQHAISDDGSRIFWTGGKGNETLFMRDVPREETILIGKEARFEDGD